MPPNVLTPQSSASLLVSFSCRPSSLPVLPLPHPLPLPPSPPYPSLLLPPLPSPSLLPPIPSLPNPSPQTYLRNNPAVWRTSAALHIISDRKTLSQLTSVPIRTLLYTLIQDTVPRRIRKVTDVGLKPPRYEIVSSQLYGPVTGFLVTSQLYSTNSLVACSIDEVLYVNTVNNLQ